MSRKLLAIATPALLVGTLAAAPAARADSVIDTLGAREIGVGESGRAEAIGASSVRLNPAGLALTRQLVFEGSYGFRSSDDASIVHASACDSTVPVPGCFYYNYVSGSPVTDQTHRFHEFGASAARAITPQLLIGITGRYFDFNSQLAGEENSNGFAVDVGALFRAGEAVRVAAVGHNLYSADEEQFPRAIGTGLSVRPGGGQLGLSADAVWHLETEEGQGTGRYGGGAEYFFTTGAGQYGYPVRIGGVYDNRFDAGYLTGGLGFANEKLGIDVAVRKQIDGGDELLILGALRLFGPTAR